nr:hypothetical protein [Tanacetum cinerariifolium]
MFFLGGSHEARKLAWIKWENAISSYDNDGLNVDSLKAFNLALLQKCRWRLLSHKNALWVKVIKALHGQEGGFDNNGCICNVRDSSFYIGYNMLYRLENEKDCLIIDRIDHCQWRWIWSRPNLGAQNSADLLDMLFEISSAEINEVEDTCVWSLGTDEAFFVNEARCIINSKILPSLAPSTFWDKNISRKVVKEKSQRLSVIFSFSLWWLWRGHMIYNWIDWLKSPMLLSSNGLG